MCLQGNLSRLQIRPHTDAVNTLQQWLPAEKSNSEEWCYCSRRPVFLRVSESDSLVMGGLIAAHFLSYFTSHKGLFKISGSLLSLSAISLEGTVQVGCVWCQNQNKLSFILNTLNQSFQKNAEFFCDCCRQISLIMRNIFLKNVMEYAGYLCNFMRWNCERRKKKERKKVIPQTPCSH